MNHTEKNELSTLRTITAREFLSIGIDEVAYVRPVHIEGRKAYAIHAADGTPLSIMDTMDTALAAIHHNDLEAVATH